MSQRAPIDKGNTFPFVPLLMLVGAGLMIGTLYGVVAESKGWFPSALIEQAKMAAKSLLHRSEFEAILFHPTKATEAVHTYRPGAVQPGLTKVVDVEGDRSLAVKVIDFDGTEVQRWRVEWQDIWPDATHLTDAEVPHQRPGTHIHGAEILADGSVVFNFEHLGMVRLDACGKTVWKLPVRTHHSMFVDGDGNLWASAQENHSKPWPAFPMYQAPFIEPLILKVSPEGKVLERKSVFELLRDNGHEGDLYVSTTANLWPGVTGDTLHLNDVEVFPSTMTPGVFRPGDVMISIRNINAIFVFDPQWKLKYHVAGGFVRQHDPDFDSGDEISIYDNHNNAFKAGGAASRIVVVNARTGEQRTVFEGTAQRPFFSSIMGKHQWLANGNLLLAESMNGRALEIAPDGAVAWEFNHLVGEGRTGLLEEVERLPPGQDAAFFERARAACAG